MRKPRPQGPLNTLSPEKREVLHRWLQENLTFSQIAARLKAELGIVTSPASLSNYYQRWSKELIATRAESQTIIIAGGVEITVTCPRAGEMKFAVQPLPPRSGLEAEREISEG